MLARKKNVESGKNIGNIEKFSKYRNNIGNIGNYRNIGKVACLQIPSEIFLKILLKF